MSKIVKSIEEMNDVIQDFCGHQTLCEQCSISKVCDMCGGDFEGNSEACKEAYNTISNTTVKTNDPVNPNHYKQGGIECIDALKSATIGKRGIEAVCTANVIKYLWRYEEKNGLEDIHKAQWYLNRLEKEVSKNE